MNSMNRFDFPPNLNKFVVFQEQKQRNAVAGVKRSMKVTIKAANMLQRYLNNL